MGDQLRKDVGRLLWIGFEGASVDAALAKTLREGDAGGVTLFKRNLPTDGEAVELDALTALNGQLHDCGAASGKPLLISVDQEGGRVQRIREPRYPAMHHLAEMPNDEAVVEAERLGTVMGTQLAAWGFDIDFAPVLDVNTNPDNPIIGDRAFGDTPEAASLRALAFARGLEASGVLGCGKHFPGHGDTATDSHLCLPRLDHDMERLREVELYPFREAARVGLPMLMTAHVLFTALDPEVPATLSRRVVTELLRDEMGYQGVVLSDDLDMKAIADNFGVGEAAVMAIRAGCDVLLLCRSLEHQVEAREALIAEAEKDAAFRERIAESCARVDALKG